MVRPASIIINHQPSTINHQLPAWQLPPDPTTESSVFFILVLRKPVTFTC